MRKIFLYILTLSLIVAFSSGCLPKKKVTYNYADNTYQTSNYSEHTNKRVKTRGGSYHIARWENIPPAYSKISIISEKDVVKARRAKEDLGRGKLSQAFLLSNGSMIYEKHNNVSKSAVLSPAEQIMKRYNRHPKIVSNGITIQEQDIKKVKYNDGDAYYTLVQSPTLKCYLFFRYSEDTNLDPGPSWVTPHYQAITGSYCGDPKSANVEALQTNMLSFLANVRFDNGEYTRKQILSAALQGQHY